MTKSKALGFSALLFLAVSEPCAAQGLFGRIRDRVKDAVTNKVESTIDRAVDGVVNGAFDGAESAVKDAVSGKDDEAGISAGKGSEGATAQALETTYAKSDFVAGDEIIFEDNLEGEQVGEFPSKWNLERGNAEIAKVNGETVICMLGTDSWISPLMKNPKNYLTDVYTVEFDFLCPASARNGSFELDFMAPDASRDQDIYTVEWGWYDLPDIQYGWTNTSGDRSDGRAQRQVVADGKWHHFALSFNKRAMKAYLDGKRLANVPNVQAGAGWLTFWSGHGDDGQDKYIKNVRIAKGAVPLYDRMMTDGKFVTYGITFDVGKSVIKPESFGEINRIVQLMNENPTLKFEVAGHTDSTGGEAANQTLSFDRAKAIVDKLVELGIAKDRLNAVGKGQGAPIASNSTPEGRAKNRRVEFVKM